MEVSWSLWHDSLTCFWGEFWPYNMVHLFLVKSCGLECGLDHWCFKFWGPQVFKRKESGFPANGFPNWRDIPISFYSVNDLEKEAPWTIWTLEILWPEAMLGSFLFWVNQWRDMASDETTNFGCFCNETALTPWHWKKVKKMIPLKFILICLIGSISNVGRLADNHPARLWRGGNQRGAMSLASPPFSGVKNSCGPRHPITIRVWYSLVSHKRTSHERVMWPFPYRQD